MTTAAVVMARRAGEAHRKMQLISEEFDFIILGAGPNGLSLGAYLARAQQSVLVLSVAATGPAVDRSQVTVLGLEPEMVTRARAMVVL